MASMFTEHEQVDVARIVLMRMAQRRLSQDDSQAGPDVKTALDNVDPCDWTSLLRWSCVLADQCEGKVGA
jgi:hypothetical protein